MKKLTKLFSVGLLLAGTPYGVWGAYVDDDASSSTSWDTTSVDQGGPSGGEVPNPRDLLAPFAFGNARVNGVMYSDFPFSLPNTQDVVTVHLKPIPAVAQLEFTTGQRGAMDHLMDQLIIEDFAYLGSLIRLRRTRDFGMHFYGVCRNANQFDEVTRLFGVWSESGTLEHLKHLDFAFASPERGGLNLREGVERAAVLERIHALLDQDGLDLETLSLRFMHLTSGDVEVLKTKLITKESPNSQIISRKRHRLQRLILSFNEIDDRAMGIGGSISSMLNDTINLPNLRVIDLQGNNIEKAKTWKLRSNLANRDDRTGHKPLLRLGFNSITDPDSVLEVIESYTDFGRWGNVPEARIQFLRDVFDGRVDRAEVAQDLTYPATPDEKPKELYGNLGNLVWAMKSAEHLGKGFSSLDLGDRRLAPSVALKVLEGIPARDLVTLNLDRAFAPGEVDEHSSIVSLLREKTSTRTLVLRGNEIGRLVETYRLITMPLRNLRVLDFSLNSIGSQGDVKRSLNSITNGLAENPNDISLNYSQNLLSDDHVRTLITGLEDVHTLRHLNLSGNMIALATDVLRANLVTYLGDPRTRKLYQLDLSGNPLGEGVFNDLRVRYEGVVAIAEARPVLTLTHRLANGTNSAITDVGNREGFLRLLTHRPGDPRMAEWVKKVRESMTQEQRDRTVAEGRGILEAIGRNPR